MRVGSRSGSQSLRIVDTHRRPHHVDDLLKHPGRSVLKCRAQTSKTSGSALRAWFRIVAEFGSMGFKSAACGGAGSPRGWAASPAGTTTLRAALRAVLGRGPAGWPTSNADARSIRSLGWYERSDAAVRGDVPRVIPSTSAKGYHRVTGADPRHPPAGACRSVDPAW